MGVNLKKTSHIVFFVVILPALSIGLSWLFYKLFPNPPFYIETLTPLLAYSILYELFEYYFWHWPVFSWFGVVCVPDLNGRWSGWQISTYQTGGANTKINSYLEIKQTFSKVFVKAFYDRSESDSVVGSFYETVSGDVYLYYTYDNDPNSLSSGTMTRHRGTAKLKFIKQDKKILGSYFNSIGNSGDMSFDFESSNLKNCF